MYLENKNDPTAPVYIIDWKTGQSMNPNSYKNQQVLYAYLKGKEKNWPNDVIVERTHLIIFYPLGKEYNKLDPDAFLRLPIEEQAMRCAKEIVFTEADLKAVIDDYFIQNILMINQTDFSKFNGSEGHLGHDCSYCPFAGAKPNPEIGFMGCPKSLEAEIEFPEGFEVVTSEDYKKRKAMREAYNETEDFDYADDMYLEVDDEFFDNEEFDEEPNEDSEVESFDDLLYDDLLNDSEFDDYDDTVSDEFEAELDSYEDAGGDYTDDYLLEALAKKFGGDAQLALKESKGDKMNAVLHLANQVRKLREASAKSICSQVGQRLERVMKNPVNLDDFCGYLLNVGRTANSEQGIIIDDSAIGKVGQRLTTGEDISRFVITCCSYTTNPKAAVQFCKKYANQIGASILKGVKAGNANAALGQFDYASYLARLQA